MSPAYITAVLNDYEQKKLTGALAMNLREPTAANIKKACIVVCTKRFSLKDGRVLEAFFQEGRDQEIILKAIQRKDPDTFKPLRNYLRNETRSTDEKNIELLAWLIDFKRRPYNYKADYTMPDANLQVVGETAADEQIVIKDEVSTFFPQKIAKAAKRDLRQPIAIIVLILATIAGITVYNGGAIVRGPVGIANRTGAESCMYWTGEHFEPIACTEKRNGVAIIAMDISRLKHFKRILQPDTLNSSDVSWVWYIKIDGDIEFYTASGFHPIKTDRGLHPLTRHIYQKYIFPLRKQRIQSVPGP